MHSCSIYNYIEYACIHNATPNGLGLYKRQHHIMPSQWAWHSQLVIKRLRQGLDNFEGCGLDSMLDGMIIIISQSHRMV